MPAQKGRKKGRNRDRRERSSGEELLVDDKLEEDVDGGGRRAVDPQGPAVHPPQPMPSSMARATGALLAILTAVIAFYMVYNGLQAESAVDGAARVAVGLSLVLLSAVVAVLSVAPEFVRDVVQRRRRRRS